MNTYSIARIGSEYVVLAGERRILKLASRRRAAKLVVDAAELLSEQSAPSFEAEARSRSIAGEQGVAPDPHKVP